MKTKLLGVVTGAIVGLMLSQASAATITLLDTYRIEQGNGWVVNNSGGIGQSLALPFTTPDKPGQIHIGEIRAQIMLPYYGTTGSVDIGIMANVPYHDTWPTFPFGDIPTGTFLYDTNISLTQDVGISFDPKNWKLDPNTKYWLVAIANDGTYASWRFGGPQELIETAISSSWTPVNSDWFNWYLDLPEAYIDAKGPAVVANPIPPAGLLFATGLGGLGLLGWRRKKAA